MLAMTFAALPVRIWERASSKVTSHTQCSRFLNASHLLGSRSVFFRFWIVWQRFGHKRRPSGRIELGCNRVDIVIVAKRSEQTSGVKATEA